jgi:hypothetical protein
LILPAWSRKQSFPAPSDTSSKRLSHALGHFQQRAFTRLRRAPYFLLRGHCAAGAARTAELARRAEGRMPGVRESRQREVHPGFVHRSHGERCALRSLPSTGRRQLGHPWPRTRAPCSRVRLRCSARTTGVCALKELCSTNYRSATRIIRSTLPEAVARMATKSAGNCSCISCTPAIHGHRVPSLVVRLRRKCPQEGPHDVGP